MCSLLSFIRSGFPTLYLLQRAGDRGTISNPAKWNRRREEDMTKGHLRGNKEVKKPKADKPKGSVSAYKQSLAKSGQALVLPKK
jgi:hypothetical protein